jgi:hypothetical protein
MIINNLGNMRKNDENNRDKNLLLLLLDLTLIRIIFVRISSWEISYNEIFRKVSSIPARLMPAYLL